MSTVTRIIRRATVVALTVAGPAGPLAAQSGTAWQVEWGAFGSLTKYDDVGGALGSSLGSGARLGLYLSRIFSVEASGDYTPTELTTSALGVNVGRVGATLFAHTRPSVFGSAYLGAGVGRFYYRGALDVEDTGPHMILGDRFSLGGRAALRVEGRVDYFPSTNLLTDESALSFGASVGLSIFAFGGPPRDADRDLVADGSDECPGTPEGAEVDSVGCPTDGDGDAVYDGLDRCPDTPQGAIVDTAGCPTDTDDDGVADGIDVCPNTPVGAAVDTNGCPTDADADGVFDGLDQCADTPRGATVDTVGCPSDGDSDGVFDGIDACPNTPGAVTVDETGCPADSDGDGVPNNLDQCPDTPEGVAVNETGCPEDLDGDGVLNSVDQCPGTPPGVEVDERGCLIERDDDGDGIPNGRDRCPNTAPGQNIDAVGCPMLFEIEEEGTARPLVLQGVTFQSGRSALTESSFAVLNEVAASLKAHPDVRVEVAGHTDATGSRELNLRLSLQRAQAVMAYLARQGVEPSRMEARGYGPDEPIATNDTAEGRAQNRRVELKLLESGSQ
ncbi:MAG: OmpA family protein [Gemmatimonadales bacterium]|jgi:outer membrane protein OmpA-like peptidoglycan-associated protein